MSKWSGLILSQFSDEFQTDGRTFYPGDDPYWTAVDLWYGVTQDLEVCPNQIPAGQPSLMSLLVV